MENAKGLTNAAAEKALTEFGFNELSVKRQYIALKILLRQFQSFIVWILIAAAVISYIADETVNFWAISFVIAFVVMLGFFQEFRAEKAMEALKKIVEPMTHVMRDGHLMHMEVRRVVPGDTLVLQTGDKIPADAEVTEETSLKTDESILTGESVPAKKQPGDTIFAGTQIVYGKCVAKVKSTGMKTELGKIASMIQESEDLTPLQKRMDKLGKTLAGVAVFACALILLLGVYRGAEPIDMLIVALALAVAAVPEGLPLTMTLALSFGMKKMAEKKAVIRRMMAVETLGSTTVICTDKTGTLTKNELTVQKLWAGGKVISVSGAGYRPNGEFRESGKKSALSLHPYSNLFRTALLCNNAELAEKEGRFEPVGDPTEVALITLAKKAGSEKEKLNKQYPRVEEILFTSARKMMTTVHKHAGAYLVCCKGAPEELLGKCSHIQEQGKIRKLSAKEKETILKANHTFAKKSLRVLALAEKTINTKQFSAENLEKGLVFLGLVGMMDPPRPEVKSAIETCKRAGIRIIMITGDQENTAAAIARQIGLSETGRGKAITGKTLDTLSDEELEKRLEETDIFARTHSEHKMRLVEVLKKKGHIVAMTGDGVNDAPALKKADIGIAMGIKGTDVSKEAADMILQDDNFSTIVEAVKEGRRIYQNIEKFTSYLVSCNFFEIIILLLGVIFFPFELLPLLALQILLINMFAEEFPAVGLGVDIAHTDLMARPPRKPNEAILNRVNVFIVFSVSTFMALIGFILFILQEPYVNIDYARTMVFATILIMVIFNTYNFRSLRESIFTVGLGRNLVLSLGVPFILLVTLVIMYLPATQKTFSFVSLSLGSWLTAIASASLLIVYMEALKWFRRKQT